MGISNVQNGILSDTAVGRVWPETSKWIPFFFKFIKLFLLLSSDFIAKSSS